MASNLEQELIEFISDELLGGQLENDLKPDDDLLLSELLDSMSVVRLVAFIEQQFQVSVPPEDVTIENFVSVNTITSYLNKQMGSTENPT